MVRTHGNGHWGGSAEKYVQCLHYTVAVRKVLSSSFWRNYKLFCLICWADNVLLSLSLFCNLLPSYLSCYFLFSYFFLFSFKLDICFQLLEALEDDYRPPSTSSSSSTLRNTGRVNDINRLTESHNNPSNDNNAMQPNTNGSDGSIINLVRTART